MGGLFKIRKEWERAKRSWGRRWRELRLPAGYRRLGTRYGGWWVDRARISLQPLLIDCGLGEDISFPVEFLRRFGGRVIGVEPNPRSLAYSERHRPEGMEIRPLAFWREAGANLTFHTPRPQDDLPEGADGVSGSLVGSHEYVGGGGTLEVTTTSLAALLREAGREDCDVLKLDIEGAEYEVLDALCASGDICRAGQLLVEFHHRVTAHTLDDTRRSAQRICDAGFELVHTEGRNYIFRRRAQ